MILDNNDLERERGITITSKNVSVVYKNIKINIIDTPGHVDFSYEVSRSIAACEGALLVVDATQGIQAQTISNLYLAIEHDLEIIPVINKIDMVSAQPDEVAEQISNLIGTPKEEILRISAKEGRNVIEVLETVVQHVPPPTGDLDAPPRALVFDSHYDPYKGVVAYVRMVDGKLEKTDDLHMIATGVDFRPVEIDLVGR